MLPAADKEDSLIKFKYLLLSNDNGLIPDGLLPDGLLPDGLLPDDLIPDG